VVLAGFPPRCRDRTGEDGTAEFLERVAKRVCGEIGDRGAGRREGGRGRLAGARHGLGKILDEAERGDRGFAEMRIDALQQFAGEVLEFERDRAGAGDDQAAGEQFFRCGDGSDGGADDGFPVGEDLGGGGVAAAKRGPDQAGHQGADGAGAVDMPYVALVGRGGLGHTGKMSCGSELLRWYGRHRRQMPWRALPGQSADPYRVWLSEIMLQQTTVAAVIPYFEKFVRRFPDVKSLARAPEAEVMQAWAGLGYYARARNLHACAKAVAAMGAFPTDIEGLRALPGIGPYTAAAVAAIAFGVPVVPIDGNVERVVARRFAIAAPLPEAKRAIAEGAARLGAEPAARARPSDFAQALFDLGATVCTPRDPACGICPWTTVCEGRRLGIAAELPRKAAKRPRPVRHGVHFWLTDAAGRVLLRRRPPRGLLGGMTEFPGTPWRSEPWTAAESSSYAPMPAAWRDVGDVRHGLTHFELFVRVQAARVEAITAEGFLRDAGALAQEALPSVMRKCARLMEGG